MVNDPVNTTGDLPALPDERAATVAETATVQVKGFILDGRRLEEATSYVSWQRDLSEPAAIRKSRTTVSDGRRSGRSSG